MVSNDDVVNVVSGDIVSSNMKYESAVNVKSRTWYVSIPVGEVWVIKAIDINRSQAGDIRTQIKDNAGQDIIIKEELAATQLTIWLPNDVAVSSPVYITIECDASASNGLITYRILRQIYKIV